MSDYIFENKEEHDLYSLTADEIQLVSVAFVNNQQFVQVLDAGYWVDICQRHELSRKRVYRVLAKPYTLDDAIQEMDDTKEFISRDDALRHCKAVARKLAKSLGGDK